MKKRAVLIYLLVFMVTGLVVNEAAQAAKKQVKPSGRLTGRVFEYDYAEETYTVSVVSEDTLKWECTRGENAGQQGEETFSMQFLGNDKYLIAWVDEDMVNNVHYIDPSGYKVSSFIIRGKQIIDRQGTLEER